MLWATKAVERKHLEENWGADLAALGEGPANSQEELCAIWAPDDCTPANTLWGRTALLTPQNCEKQSIPIVI